ncbi:MAG: hypothetical protein PWR03_238 [Tenuifilum sp.]|jgi:hypothetical protein|uniref:plasmid pRiA4b ORF-3 family protein n=1 Tax=Tenuifilum sp. TaxID=2760880 RepID=UPI0024AC2957|nr:plasmid pRiA4b ORF-3 family protein [Tenuifilum sp.]MDI3526055.1 hypothetical protein [Tenuifilum sp.]
MIDVKLTIVNSRPEIYRVIRVPEGLSLQLFHEVIQATFEWTNVNSHFFKLGDTIIKNEEEKSINLVKDESSRFYYVYDFADFWTISIDFLAISNGDNKTPICIEGKRKSPPEDSGGIVNYTEVVELLKRHKEGERKYPLIADWLGEDFDPEEFDCQRINKNLQNLIL